MPRSLPIALIVLAACSDAGAPSGPLCDAPAPVYNERQGFQPGVIVAVTPDSNVALLVERWSERYRFQPTQVWTTGFTGFTANIDDATVSALRCEAGVRFIEYDTPIVVDVRAH